MGKIQAFLKLIRPANIVTAISDILAGVAISGLFTTHFEVPINLIHLILATSCLYAAGIVFNDIFDYQIDKIERPERVLPQKSIELRTALYLAIGLTLLGIIFSVLTSALSGIIAICISFASLTYNSTLKKHSILGPLNMGCCRGLNLLLGISIIESNVFNEIALICLIPILFVAGITLTSQKEVSGNNQKTLLFALTLDALIVVLIIIYFNKNDLMILKTAPFIIIWIGMNYYAKLKALFRNTPKNIQYAVKISVLSLIPLNTIYVVGFGTVYIGIIVLFLLPLSIWLSKTFSVT